MTEEEIVPPEQREEKHEEQEQASSQGLPHTQVGDTNELSFSEHLPDRFDLLWQQCIEPSQRLLEQVCSVLRGRAQLERQYGKSLVAMPDDVKLDASANTVHEAVSSVMVNFRNRGEQSINLAEEIENDIVLTFEEVMKQHKEASKRMWNDAQRLTSYARDTRTVHQKLARHFFSVCTESEMVSQDLIQSVSMKPEERSKLGLRAIELSAKAKHTHTDYLSSIDQANRAQALYNEHMPSILVAMQDMEMKRMKCLQDSLMKLAVYETSWLRNLQYDIDATVKATEVCEPAKDLQAFIAKHRGEGSPPVPREMVAKPFWELGKPKTKEITPVRKACVEAEAVIKQHANGLQPVLTGFLSEVPPEGFVEKHAKSVEQLKSNMFDLRARAAFFQVFQVLLIQRQPPPEEPGKQLTIYDCRPVKITAACFEVIVSLVLEACTRCDQQADAWCGKTIMTIVQYVSCDGDGGRMVVLLNRVYNHPLWNKVSLWEDVLVAAICEAHAAEAIWRRQLPNYAEPPKGQPVLTPFIDSFVRLMSQFGIKGEQARDCIRQALKKHVQVLGPWQEHYTRHLIQHVDILEAQVLAASKAAAGNAALQPNFSPPPRQLEERASENFVPGVPPKESSNTSSIDEAPPTRGGTSELVEAMATTGNDRNADSSEDVAAIALGEQSGSLVASTSPGDGFDSALTATTALDTEEPSNSDPVAILGSVDHSDVFG